jgi:hypothetical protein
VAEQPAREWGQRYLKPGWLVSRVINPVLMRLGIIPTLAVRGRISGEWRTVPVDVLDKPGVARTHAPRQRHQERRAETRPPLEKLGAEGDSPSAPSWRTVLF